MLQWYQITRIDVGQCYGICVDTKTNKIVEAPPVASWMIDEDVRLVAKWLKWRKAKVKAVRE